MFYVCVHVCVVSKGRVGAVGSAGDHHSNHASPFTVVGGGEELTERHWKVESASNSNNRHVLEITK